MPRYVFDILLDQSHRLSGTRLTVVGEDETLEESPLASWSQCKEHRIEERDGVVGFIWLMLSEALRGLRRKNAAPHMYELDANPPARSLLNILGNRSKPVWIGTMLEQVTLHDLLTLKSSGSHKSIQLNPEVCRPRDIQCYHVGADGRPGKLSSAQQVTIAIQSLAGRWGHRSNNKEATRTLESIVGNLEHTKELKLLGEHSVGDHARRIIDKRDSYLLGQTRRVQILSILETWMNEWRVRLQAIQREATREVTQFDHIDSIKRRVETEYAVTAAVLHSIAEHVRGRWKKLEKLIGETQQKLDDVVTVASSIEADTTSPRSEDSVARPPKKDASTLRPLRKVIDDLMNEIPKHREWMQTLRDEEEQQLIAMLDVSAKRWNESG